MGSEMEEFNVSFKPAGDKRKTLAEQELAQRDLSTAKRVHYTTLSNPTGSKAPRAMPGTPIPGNTRAPGSRGSSRSASPEPGEKNMLTVSSSWRGVEGDAKQYMNQDRGSVEDSNRVHHAVSSKIEDMIKANPEISHLELRDVVKQELQRPLTRAELDFLLDALERGKAKREQRASMVGEEAAKQCRDERAAQLRELEGGETDTEDEAEERVGVPESEWDPDDTKCFFCSKPFGIMRYRHHCRGCGKNVCDADSQRRK